MGDAVLDFAPLRYVQYFPLGSVYRSGSVRRASYRQTNLSFLMPVMAMAGLLCPMRLRKGHSEIAAALLRAGADPRSDDRLGLTPLHYASRKGKSRCGQPAVGCWCLSSHQQDQGHSLQRSSLLHTRYRRDGSAVRYAEQKYRSDIHFSASGTSRRREPVPPLGSGP